MNIESILIEILIWMLIIAAVCTVAVALYGIFMDRRHVKKLVTRELENERRVWLDARKEEADPLPLGVTRLKGVEDTIRADSEEEEKPIDEVNKIIRESLLKACSNQVSEQENTTSCCPSQLLTPAQYAAFQAVRSGYCEPMTALDVANMIGYSTSHTRRLLHQLVTMDYIREDSLKVPYTFRVSRLHEPLS